MIKRSCDSAKNVDSLSQMHIGLDQGIIMFVEPYPAGSFVQEMILQAVGGQVFLGLKIKHQGGPPIAQFATDNGKLEAIEQVLVEWKIFFIHRRFPCRG